MKGTKHIPTREELIDLIGNASLSGYLGLFVGTGFSKAATGNTAPSFEELIRLLIQHLSLSVDIDSDPLYRRKTMPQIASSLINEVGAMYPPVERAGERFREEIAHLCNFTVDPLLRAKFAAALGRLRPSWVITTNYDLVLEMLLDDSVSVLPDQPLVARPDRVPIYHLHGHRLNPSSIKITEEDYVGLIGPIDYQRLKLPLILLESTTVMLGYSLGDMNVKAAMEWARSFRGEEGVKLSSGQGVVIQALYVKGTASPTPYEGPNGEFVLEIDDVLHFLEELAGRLEDLAASLAKAREDLDRFLSDSAKASAIAELGPERKTFLDIVQSALPFAQATRFIDFLNQALDPIWEKARENGGFGYYDNYLQLLIDILERIEVGQCNPALLGYLADALDRVGWYIDPKEGYGTAWGATRTWQSQHHRIRDGLKKELKSYAETNGRDGLISMMRLA